MVVFIAGLAACRREDPPPRHRRTEPDPTEVVHSGISDAHTGGATADTAGATGHTGAPFDCDAPPPGPRSFTSTTVITTEEDFDFDATGLLLAQNYYTIKGTDRYGAVQVVATGLTGDAAGIRVAPSGDFVYASPDDGRLVGVSRATGGSRTLLAGLHFPNSVEMGLDGVAYLSEFDRDGRVVWYDTTTDQSGEIGRLDYVNGITLSMDEQVLYLASANGYWAGPTTIWAVDRQPDGTFGGAVRHVADLPQLVTSITVDVCENLYLVSFHDGMVYRYTLATDAFELVADLGGNGYAGFSAIRFSPGLGGFSTTSLYATNRLRLYEIDLGLEGRHVLR